MTANAVKSALRSHARYHRQADRILQQVNLTLWTGSAGDRHVTLFDGLIETATGQVCCSSAGRPSIMLLGVHGVLSVARNSIKLGESPEADLSSSATNTARRNAADLHRRCPQCRRWQRFSCSRDRRGQRVGGQPQPLSHGIDSRRRGGPYRPESQPSMSRPLDPGSEAHDGLTIGACQVHWEWLREWRNWQTR